MASAYLQGGPCDATLHDVTPAEGDTGEIVCRGGLYRVTSPPKHHNGHLVFAYAGKADTGEPPETPKAPHGLGGWKALRKSINRGMPNTLAHAQKVNKATLRSLHRASKVRL